MQSLQSTLDSRKYCKVEDVCFLSWKWFQKCYLIADTSRAEVTLIHKDRKSTARIGQFCLVMFRNMWPREWQDWHLQLSCHCRQATLSFKQGNVRYSYSGRLSWPAIFRRNKADFETIITKIQVSKRTKWNSPPRFRPLLFEWLVP